ncbi:hypothetical protein AOLI_G00261690 [Acnodon oligacanthus]
MRNHVFPHESTQKGAWMLLWRPRLSLKHETERGHQYSAISDTYKLPERFLKHVEDGADSDRGSNSDGPATLRDPHWAPQVKRQRLNKKQRPKVFGSCQATYRHLGKSPQKPRHPLPSAESGGFDAQTPRTAAESCARPAAYSSARPAAAAAGNDVSADHNMASRMAAEAAGEHNVAVQPKTRLI